MAPPRYPVRRIAPRTDVRGTTYATTEARSTTPRGTMELSGYPSFNVPSTTKESFSSLMTASKVRNSTTNPLRTRPVQIFARDLDPYDPPPAAASFGQFPSAMRSISVSCPARPGRFWVFPLPCEDDEGGHPDSTLATTS